VTANHLLPAAMTKEIRAIAPGWLACMASFAIAALAGDGGFRGLVIPVYFVGSIALGALSIGHEYSGGTLTLLLSQPRRRERLYLLKLGVLALLLLTLSAVAGIALFAASGSMGVPVVFGVDAGQWQVLELLVPLLCGLFIAPSLTMLCRNALAGMVFTVGTTCLVVLVGEVSAAVKYGAAATTTPDAMALKVAILWWGMLAISAVAAIFSWRLFMRLEAIDGGDQAVRLPWLRSRTTTIEAAPPAARRHPLWLLLKKELRLQQLSFVVAALYVLGWFGIWSVRWWIPGSHEALLFALTAINAAAASLLAGSLASAEERQLGTVEWHTLLPMPARAQWMVKAGTAVGVAALFGLGVPALLSSLTRSEVQPLSTAGVGLSLILLTVVSLYVSSLCASGVRALMWSLPVGFGVMLAFVSSRVSVRLGFDPFFFLNYSYSWGLPGFVTLGTRLHLLLTLLIVLAVAMYAGALGLLLRFARANHTSSERSPRRIVNQMARLGAYLALVMSLWFGVSRTFLGEMRERNRAAMQKFVGTLVIGAVDSGTRPVRQYTVVVFPEGRVPSWANRSFSFNVDQAGRPFEKGPLETHLRPGRYSIVAVETLGSRSAEGDPELLARLRARAVPVTVAAGELKAVNLTVATD
jgi:hypothetical protein